MSARPIPTPGAVDGTTSTHDTEDWSHRAACLSEDGELFFAADGEREPGRSLRTAAAKAVCRVCPVRQMCLDEALEHRIDHGIWGGLDEDERRLLLHRLPTRSKRAAAA